MKIKNMSSPERLSTDEAFKVMINFLEKYYIRTGSDDIASILSDVRLLEKEKTSDPAAWSDWIDSVNKIINLR